MIRGGGGGGGHTLVGKLELSGSVVRALDWVSKGC